MSYQPSIGDVVWFVCRGGVTSGVVDHVSKRELGTVYYVIDGSCCCHPCVRVHPDEIGAQKELRDAAELTVALCGARIRQLMEAREQP